MTRASGRSSAIASAIAPLPVPTSTTRGCLEPGDRGERTLDDDLGLGPRDERAGVGLERQPPEAPVAEHVGERLAAAAALDERACRRSLCFGQRPVELV